MNSITIPLRAEEISISKIKELRKLSPTLDENIKNIVERVTSGKNITEVSAPKGTGKTLSLKGALNELYESREILSDGISFNPENLWKPWQPPFMPISPEYYLETSPPEGETDVKVVDNIHYVFDLVNFGLLSKNKAEKIGKAVLEELENGKQLILVDETPLFLLKKSPENEDVLTSSWEEIYERLKKENKKLPDSVYEEFWVSIKKPSFEELCRIYDVFADEEVKLLIENYSDRTPRSFVNLINKCGKTLTSRTVIKSFEKELRKKLERRRSLDEHLIEYILENPVLWYDVHRAYKIARKYDVKSIDSLKQKIEECKETYESYLLDIKYLLWKIAPFLKKIDKYVKDPEQLNFPNFSEAEYTLYLLEQIRDYIDRKIYLGSYLPRLNKEYRDLKYLQGIAERESLFQNNPEKLKKYLQVLSKNYTKGKRNKLPFLQNRDFSKIINGEINAASYLLEMLLAAKLHK
ncbi:MAG: hypothetical protein GXO63_02385 [Candidatus Micrarchaeota archaeon]|nr:hypothetical protein [Candidatus Micrarchaeota archaeon]